MSGKAGGEGALAERFRRLIANTGPITLAQYMGEANAHYYSTRNPLGAGGDFITAPEISQMFGELIGLWLTDIWVRAGKPTPVHYVELGPGRGTLARDALRVMRRMGMEPQVHLVEGSVALKKLQLDTVPDALWHHDLSSLPEDGPLLIVGNEFLDALPVRQLVRTSDGWRERMVATEGGQFVCIAGDKPMDAAVPAQWSEADEGTLLETCPAAASVVQDVAALLARQGGSALFIDYGHDTPRTGSTLQAVRAHQKVDAFVDPGEADLTCHVDFAVLADVVRRHGAQWLGTTTQGAWLTALGIEARAAALSKASPAHAEDVRVAMERLTSAEEMGDLFKVMGLAAPGWPAGAGF